MALHESAEDYLEALYLLQKSYQRYVQSILQIFSDTVNQVLRIWIDEKMVQKDDKGILSLTQKGSECAKEIYEKHCFSYELLVSAGIDDKLAQKEVCKMEHDLSEESFQKLKELFKNMNAPRNR